MTMAKCPNYQHHQLLLNYFTAQLQQNSEADIHQWNRHKISYKNNASKTGHARLWLHQSTKPNNVWQRSHASHHHWWQGTRPCWPNHEGNTIRDLITNGVRCTLITSTNAGHTTNNYKCGTSTTPWSTYRRTTNLQKPHQHRWCTQDLTARCSWRSVCERITK